MGTPLLPPSTARPRALRRSPEVAGGGLPPPSPPADPDGAASPAASLDAAARSPAGLLPSSASPASPRLAGVRGGARPAAARGAEDAAARPRQRRRRRRRGGARWLAARRAAELARRQPAEVYEAGELGRGGSHAGAWRTWRGSRRRRRVAVGAAGWCEAELQRGAL
ncbi:atherin-like [Panicum virgatum]|uniref:atherin-like n=1 Tax=Panicum virgatum TaxID=38727 RepID=UPI0019D5376B|nr:atherin-like [Panicum virgatum]